MKKATSTKTETVAAAPAEVTAIPTEVAASVPAHTDVTAQLSLGDAGEGEEYVGQDVIPTDLPDAGSRAPRKVVAHGKIPVAEYQVTDKEGNLKFKEDGTPVTSKWLDGFAVSVVESTKHGQVEHYLQVWGDADAFLRMLLTAKAADPKLEAIMGNIFPTEGFTVQDLQTIIGNGCPILFDVPKVGVNKTMIVGTDGVSRPETQGATVLWATVIQSSGNLVFSLAGSRNRDTRAMNEALNSAKAAIKHAKEYNGGWLRGLMINNRVQAKVKSRRPNGVGTVTAAPAIATEADLSALSVPTDNRRQGRYSDNGYRNRNNGNYRGRGNGSNRRQEGSGFGRNRY